MNRIGDDQGRNVVPKELNAKLAVLLRGVQWAADDIAFRLPKDDVSKDEMVALADQLSVVANILRSHAIGTPKTIDGVEE